MMILHKAQQKCHTCLPSILPHREVSNVFASTRDDFHDEYPVSPDDPHEEDPVSPDDLRGEGPVSPDDLHEEGSVSPLLL